MCLLSFPLLTLSNIYPRSLKLKSTVFLTLINVFYDIDCDFKCNVVSVIGSIFFFTSIKVFFRGLFNDYLINLLSGSFDAGCPPK